MDQERLNHVLTAKPWERRVFIEEAAGIARYKQQRAETHGKLDATRQNLQRVRDVMEEVRRQLGSIERQARKARQYKALQQEKQALDLALLAADFEALGAEHERLTREMAAPPTCGGGDPGAHRRAHGAASAPRGGVQDMEFRLADLRQAVQKTQTEAERLLERREQMGLQIADLDEEETRLGGGDQQPSASGGSGSRRNGRRSSGRSTWSASGRRRSARAFRSSRDGSTRVAPRLAERRQRFEVLAGRADARGRRASRADAIERGASRARGAARASRASASTTSSAAARREAGGARCRSARICWPRIGKRRVQLSLLTAELAELEAERARSDERRARQQERAGRAAGDAGRARVGARGPGPARARARGIRGRSARDLLRAAPAPSSTASWGRSPTCSRCRRDWKRPWKRCSATGCNGWSWSDSSKRGRRLSYLGREGAGAATLLPLETLPAPTDLPEDLSEVRVGRAPDRRTAPRAGELPPWARGPGVASGSGRELVATKRRGRDLRHASPGKC